MTNLKDNKGSFTIEAVILMSTIITVIFTVMFAFMLIYQKVVLMYTASHAAQQGAEAWVNSNKNQSMKLKQIEEAARSKLSKGILSPKESKIIVDYDNILVQRTITVHIEQKIPFPLRGMAQYLGAKGDSLILKAKAKSAIPDPAEFIRNIDFAFEYAIRIKNGLTQVSTINMLNPASK